MERSSNISSAALYLYSLIYIFLGYLLDVFYVSRPCGRGYRMDKAQTREQDKNEYQP